MKNMHGIFAVTATPFDDKGGVDCKVLDKHLDRLLAAGVHGLLPVGATGEFAALSLEERKEVAAFTVKKAAGKVPVIVGVVSQNLDVTLELCRHAAEIKADGVMVLASPGLHLSQEEIYAMFKRVSESVTLPVMIYNNPGSSGVDIAPETMGRIAALPHMDYLKESTGDIKRLTLMTGDYADKIITFCGSEDLAFESFVMGAKGWVCVLANIAPAMSVQLYELVVEKKDLAAARAIYAKVLPVLRLFEVSGQLWQVVKYVMHKQGVGNGQCRPPRLPISEDVRAAVDALPGIAELT